ncbi:MAG: aminoacyl-tRNA hydrolase [Thermodesulfobacteriota bacterium]|nr:aminoacyl-tRNA hydrolase [Thermodesulfobacteriota bacterium]
MKLIVGLGNPGTKYKQNRHNIGFQVLESLAESANINIDKKKFNSIYGEGVVRSEKVFLVKPQTFMNLSGEAVFKVIKYFDIEHKDIIVIHDDIDLDLGRIKIQFDGGDGGHKGIHSIVVEAGTNRFIRIRVGIGRPPLFQDAAFYVLMNFKPEEKEIIKEVIERAKDAVLMILSKGLSATMNHYNQKR